MRVVGIDPSLTSTGIAIIDGGRAVTLRVESAPPKRARGDKTPVSLRERHERLRRIVDDVRQAVIPLRGPVLAVLEGPSYASAGAGTWDRAWLWGALVDRLYANEVHIALCPPTVRAKWATGSGAAGKSPVAVHLSRMWPDLDPGVTDDEWDALALASMGAQRVGMLGCELARHREQLTRVPWPDDVDLASAFHVDDSTPSDVECTA